MSKRPDIDRGPRYPEAAERFLLLVGAIQKSKSQLMSDTGIAGPTIDHWQFGRHVVRLTLSNPALRQMAAALKLTPLALIEWWAEGNITALPDDVQTKIADFRTLAPDERMDRWLALEWMLPQGRPRKSTAPPHAAD